MYKFNELFNSNYHKFRQLKTHFFTPKKGFIFTLCFNIFDYQIHDLYEKTNCSIASNLLQYSGYISIDDEP